MFRRGFLADIFFCFFLCRLYWVVLFIVGEGFVALLLLQQTILAFRGMFLENY